MSNKFLLMGFSVLFLSCDIRQDDHDQMFDFEEKNLKEEACQEELCARVILNYPWAKEEGEDAKLLNYHIEQQLAMYVHYSDTTDITTLENAITDFLDQYLAYRKEFDGEWEINVNSKLSYQDLKLVSILFDSYSYTGGAHPNTLRMYLNFDKENQRLLKNDDLVQDKEKLKALAREKFRAFHQVDPEKSLKEDGRFFLDEEEDFFLPLAMGFDENDFVLFYNPYEIGPYALGATEIRISIKELENIIIGVKSEE